MNTPTHNPQSWGYTRAALREQLDTLDRAERELTLLEGQEAIDTQHALNDAMRALEIALDHAVDAAVNEHRVKKYPTGGYDSSLWKD